MTLLAVDELNAFYGDFQALFGVGLEIGPGECIAIIGSNGAGKSTLLRSLTGLHRGRASRRMVLAGNDIGALTPSKISSMGMTLVPEGRRLFSSLSVVYELFPALADLKNRQVTRLSGGQQQMVALGRALMTNPALLLCDEISLGLAPVIVKGMYASFREVRGQGTSLVVVEQDIGQALSVADRIYCLRKGTVVLSGKPAEFTRNRIASSYFGMEEAA